MSAVTSELDQAESDLKRRGRDVSLLRRMAGALPGISGEWIESAMAGFHNFAGQFPYWADCDVGALALEDVADDMPSGLRRALLYRHAVYRAQWCASAATAGGEGAARSRHLQRTMAKLAAEQPTASANDGPAVPLGHSDARGGPLSMR